MNKISPPFVSIIIPVFNDPERLVKCLQSLEEQTYPKSSYQVIVVDNGSEESIEPIVAQFGQAQAQSESRPGSYVARNKGISLAKGSVFAFTDSDCIPTTDWIENGVATLVRVPNCGLVAGKISVFFRDPKHPTAVELYESVRAFRQKRYVEVDKYGATANLFTKRSVFEHVGGFNEKLRSGGDYEWGRRVHASGYKLVYAEDARVAHPARHSFADMYKKAIRVVGGGHALRQRSAFRELVVSLLPHPRAVIEICSNKCLRGPLEKGRVLSVLCFVTYVKAWERLRLRLGKRPER